MKSSSQSSSHRKPVGGVRSVRLCAAENVDYVEFAEDANGYKLLTFFDREQIMECSLLEDASWLEESFAFEDGVVAVQHTLTLVAERNDAAAWIEPEFYREAMDMGLCAEVELNDGRRLLVGYSERFGSQQPLRIKEIISSSGSRLVDSPRIKMTLESYDTSAAALYEGN
ncbi:MAG: hypothetical protein J6Q20_00805 [Alistipes sp.]|nr:hypothetical protein [Alistipes sp.]